MLRRIFVFAAIILFGLMGLSSLHQSPPPIAAQDGDEDEGCTSLFDEALQVVGSACAEMGRNEACYGHFAITSELQEDTTDPFEASGDIVDLIQIRSIETLPADLESGVWGVALMQVQADLPDESEDTMTFVLFGDAQLENAGISNAEDGDIQSFNFQSGDDDTCESLPDGLMVRSPDGQRARIMVNGVELTFSSTGYLTNSDTGDLVVQGLEGSIDVGSSQDFQTVTSGFYSSVPVTEFQQTGSPLPPEPVDDIQQVMLPTLFDIGDMLNDNGIGTPSSQFEVQSGTWLWTATVVESTCGHLGDTTQAQADFGDINQANSTYARIGINTYTYSEVLADPTIERTYILQFSSPTSASGYVLDHYPENDCSYRWESSYTAQ